MTYRILQDGETVDVDTDEVFPYVNATEWVGINEEKDAVVYDSSSMPIVRRPVTFEMEYYELIPFNEARECDRVYNFRTHSWTYRNGAKVLIFSGRVLNPAARYVNKKPFMIEEL